MKSYPTQTEGPLLPVSPHHGHALNQARGLKRLIYSILPRHILLPVKDELYCSWVRFKTRNTYKRFINESDLKVNIGCGSLGKKGWINVDLYDVPGVNCVYDCRHHLPFPDNSVEYIFTEHFMEHIDLTEDVPFFLNECRRVLKPGGIIRIVVPDAEKYINAYVNRSWSELSEVSSHINEQGRDTYFESDYSTMMQPVNFIFRQGHHHKYAYDYETLADLLSCYGFRDVTRREFGESGRPDLCIDLPDRASESLYIEAIKPK